MKSAKCWQSREGRKPRIKSRKQRLLRICLFASKDEGVLHDLEARVAAIEASLTDPPTPTTDPSALAAFAKDLEN